MSKIDKTACLHVLDRVLKAAALIENLSAGRPDPRLALAVKHLRKAADWIEDYEIRGPVPVPPLEPGVCDCACPGCGDGPDRYDVYYGEGVVYNPAASPCRLCNPPPFEMCYECNRLLPPERRKYGAGPLVCDTPELRADMKENVRERLAEAAGCGHPDDPNYDPKKPNYGSELVARYISDLNEQGIDVRVEGGRVVFGDEAPPAPRPKPPSVRGGKWVQ